MSCIAKIMDMNNGSKYIVVTNDATAAALRIVLNKSINVNYLKDFDFAKNDMKFDCIIMNPPYQRNLHLKILAEAIKHLKDEKSVCVNLSPIRWLQDPLAKYKKNSDYNKFEESICKHIKSIKQITNIEMNDLFNTFCHDDLGLYVLAQDGGFNYDTVRSYRGFDPIIFYKKIIEKCNTNIDDKSIKYKNRTSENFVGLLTIGGYNKDGLPTAMCVRAGKYGPFCNGKCNSKTIKEIRASNTNTKWGDVDNWPVVCFSTSDESVNFFNACQTKAYRFFVYAFTTDQNIPLKFLPFLGDAINPRTGLKGYQGEWTDDDLALYFGITPEEQKVIKETMDKYK